MTRAKVPDDIQEAVVLLSRRRCCVCFGLHGDLEVKQGQIAHLDQDNANFDLDNLAFICLPHHDQYDSKTSQSKGFLEGEVKYYRKELYDKIAEGLPADPGSKPPSTDPADRANLHVISADFELDIGKLESMITLPPDVFEMMALMEPKPRASVLVRNVGKYTVAHYVVRTAIILSEPLGPGEEGVLFERRSEWQIGGIVGMGNVWYPDEQQVAFTKWNGSFAQSDWSDLIAGKKVFYVVTRSRGQDLYGPLPETRSCRCVSLKDGRPIMRRCWAHNT